ncbi:MAG: KH domain-containing protein [Clostridiales bacterium]|nr:KH domain-containing protein [Clostridiales bacterium]
MKELLISITQGLVSDPSQVSVDVDEPNEEGVVTYHLHVAPDEMGRVIGSQGRLAKAMRVGLGAAANRNHTKISVDID